MSISNLKYLNAGAENQLVIHIYEQPSRRQLTSYLWSWLKQNSPIEDVATTRLFANRVLIDTLPSTGITVDGKVAGRTPMAIRLTERKIRFICNKPNNSLNPKG